MSSVAHWISRFCPIKDNSWIRQSAISLRSSRLYGLNKELQGQVVLSWSTMNCGNCHPVQRLAGRQ
jgi:hypothetical protein